MSCSEMSHSLLTLLPKEASLKETSLYSLRQHMDPFLLTSSMTRFCSSCIVLSVDVLRVGIVTGIPAETRGLSNEPKKSPNG
jgi:hypothetical protein